MVSERPFDCTAGERHRWRLSEQSFPVVMRNVQIARGSFAEFKCSVCGSRRPLIGPVTRRE